MNHLSASIILLQRLRLEFPFFFFFFFSISLPLRVLREEHLEVEEKDVSYKWTPREPGAMNIEQFQEFSE